MPTPAAGGALLCHVGWRSPGQPRRWIVAVYESVNAAATAARGYACFDGGGRWRVYGTTTLVLPDGTACVERAGIVAEGLERRSLSGGAQVAADARP